MVPAADTHPGESFAMPSTGESWNQFKLLEPLGRGGMGQVFLAEDSILDRKVALKFLPEKLEGDAMARERFLREAKSAAALDHPYICKIYEIGETDGKAYIAMEYIEGVTLQEKVARGPLRLPDILEIGAEIAEAVDAAHKKGIVHRDLKSPNIMVTRDGHIKVLDFGLAKKFALDGHTGSETFSESLTAHDVTPGTVIYMSPEQVKGERIDGRTDIFSLGVVLYELATGEAGLRGTDLGLDLRRYLESRTAPSANLEPERARGSRAGHSESAGEGSRPPLSDRPGSRGGSETNETQHHRFGPAVRHQVLGPADDSG